MKWNRVLIGVAVFMAAAAAVGWMSARRGPFNREPFLAEALMSDGRHRLRLLRVVEGPLDYDWKNPVPAVLSKLSFVNRMFPPAIPFDRVRKDGVVWKDIDSQRVSMPGVTFLFRIVDEKGEYAVGPMFYPQLTIVESTGFEFQADWPNHPEYAAWGVVAITRSELPRRDRQLRIKLLEHPGATRPLMFEVENPWFRLPPEEWVPQPLPATTKVDGMDVELKSFQLGTIHVEADIRTGRRAYFAQWHNTRLEDVTGNSGRNLSPFEPAWKLTSRLAPMTLDAIEKENVWSIAPMTIPEAGVTKPLGEQRTIDGVDLKLVAISGGVTSEINSASPDSGKPPVQSEIPTEDLPHITIEAAGPHPFEIVSRVTAQSKVIHQGQSTNSHPTKKTIQVGLKRFADNSPFQLEIGVGRPKEVSFFVSPKDEGARGRDGQLLQRSKGK